MCSKEKNKVVKQWKEKTIVQESPKNLEEGSSQKDQDKGSTSWTEVENKWKGKGKASMKDNSEMGIPYQNVFETLRVLNDPLVSLDKRS